MVGWLRSSPTAALSGTVATGTSLDPSLSAASLGKILNPDNRALRARVLDLLKENVFRHRYGETLASERERCWSRIMRLAEAGLFVDTITADGDGRAAALARYDTALTTVALLDHSIEVELGVSLGLFGSTVRRLGTAAQAKRWLPDVEAFREFGCFALTELGHGSNVRGIETTATYDVGTESFVLCTPTESAQKYWIGGAADRATLSTVFARLVIAGEDYGIHAFVVRLRGAPGGDALPGIHIEDCGVKAGLNGVDNGRIWFDGLRVARGDMLSGKSSVSADGAYASEEKSPDVRFSAALAALTGGRVSIAVNAVNAAKIGLTIAVRYAHTRRAFAAEAGGKETALVDYKSHQMRLMVPLAGAYVYALCNEDLRSMWKECALSGVVSKEVHVVSAGFKALHTWFMGVALQSARECCGGQGYAAVNRICVMRADRDVMTTFEGDNCVLLQQVSKALLAEFACSGKMMHDGGGAATHTASALDGSRAGSISCFANLREIFCDRERKSVDALYKRVRHFSTASKSRSSAFNAWNQSLNLAGEAGLAHMQRRMLDMFVARVGKVEMSGDAVSASALRLCGEIWALDIVDRDASFLRLRCVSTSQAEAVHGILETLCGKLAAISLTMTSAFELPPHLLAPIAFDYVSANARACL